VIGKGGVKPVDHREQRRFYGADRLPCLDKTFIKSNVPTSNIRGEETRLSPSVTYRWLRICDHLTTALSRKLRFCAALRFVSFLSTDPPTLTPTSVSAQ